MKTYKTYRVQRYYPVDHLWLDVGESEFEHLKLARSSLLDAKNWDKKDVKEGILNEISKYRIIKTQHTETVVT